MLENAILPKCTPLGRGFTLSKAERDRGGLYGLAQHWVSIGIHRSKVTEIS